MPLYEYQCPDCERIEEHWFSIEKRDTPVPCNWCASDLKRLPGGKKMLYFEEGRGRTHWSLSDKPITSYAQQKRLMKENGVELAGNACPPRLAKKGGPKRPELKEQFAANKGRWI